MNNPRSITSFDLCSDPEIMYASRRSIEIDNTLPWDTYYQSPAPYSNLEPLNTQFSGYPDLSPLFDQLTHPTDFDFDFDFSTFPDDLSTDSSPFEHDCNSALWESGVSTNLNSHDDLDTGSSSDRPLPAPRDVSKHHCEQCSQCFSTKSELARHMRKHTKPFGCDKAGCTRSFAEKRDRERHSKSCGRKAVSPSSQSEEDQQFKCPLCDFAAWRSDSVRRHIQTRHRAKKRQSAPVALLPKSS